MFENNVSQSRKFTFDSLVTWAQKNLLYVGLAVGALAAIAGGFYWHRSNTIKKEQEAHTILADVLAQYDQASQGKASWDDVIAMAQSGYEKFSTTKVAPYIVSVQIDALLAQDKKQEAIEKIDLMVSAIGSQSPLYDLYKLKQVLLKLDTTDSRDAALADLQKLASSHGNFTDAAQYYLGLYYQDAGDTQKAIEAWQPLLAMHKEVTDENGRSPWALMAEAKMNGLA